MKTTTLLQIGCIGLMLSGAALVSDANAQSPYGFRGPHRDGIYQEAGLLKTWPADGPQLLWETLNAGKGYSSPVVVGDRLFITGMNEDETKEIFSAYSTDGKLIYQKEYGTPWEKTYPETRTTPTIVDDKAYVISGSGEIVCLNTKDGSIVWKVDGGKLFERETGPWGTAECPLVFDNKVIYTPAGSKTTMVALDAATGKTVWESKALNEAGAYVSPILVTWNGKRQIIGSTGTSVIGVNPDNGEIEWRFSDWKRPMPKDMPKDRPAPPAGQSGQRPQMPANFKPSNIAPNTPLFRDGRVFFCQGYDIGGYMLQLGDDMKSAKQLWRTDDLDTHHGGYVLINGVIYGSNWINNNQGNWVAVDWNSGKTLYDDAWTGKGKGCTISADGMLYCMDERRGTVGLVKPATDKFTVISEFRITKGEGPYWAHPAIVNGVLYVRHGNALMAYKVK